MKFRFLKTTLALLILSQATFTVSAENTRWISPAIGAVIGVVIGGLVNQYFTKKQDHNTVQDNTSSSAQPVAIITGSGLIGALFGYLLFGHLQSPILAAPTNVEFSGASVLPVVETNGEKVVILTQERWGNHKGSYDAFGGGRNGKENPIETAGREFYEEAMAPYIPYTKKMGTERLQSYDVKQIIDFKDTNNPEWRHFTYLVRFDEDEMNLYKKHFYAVLDNPEIQKKYKEKKAIATVKWEDLKAAVQQSIGKRAVGVKVNAVLVDPSTGEDKLVVEQITLRPPLVKSLRLIFKD